MTDASLKAQQTAALFISDLHLQASLPKTTQAFLDFMSNQAVHTQQLYLLGDIFEYWAGDDDMTTPYHQQIAQAIRAVSDQGVQVFWIAGNRDFLVGKDFAAAAKLTILEDPYVLHYQQHQFILSHGDALCTDDHAYMAFRQQVRNPAWQAQFLSLPLAQRKAMIENVRQTSQNSNMQKSTEIMDVNSDAVNTLFETTQVNTLIHGHTHRPALHHVSNQRLRYVLPDWEYDVTPPRGGWMSLTLDGTLHRYDANGNEIL